MFFHHPVGKFVGRENEISASATKTHDDGRTKSRFSFGSLFGGLDGTRVAWTNHNHVLACDSLESNLSQDRSPVVSTSQDFFRLKKDAFLGLDVLVVSPPQPRLGRLGLKQSRAVNSLSTLWMRKLCPPTKGPDCRPRLVLVFQKPSILTYRDGSDKKL